MKALDKDRGRRYESASAFAADVQRYLAGEPVLAAPASQWYRLRKFARRHKGGLAVAGLVLFFLAALGGVASWAALQQGKQQAALEADIGRDLDEARALCRQQRLREASALLDHARALVTRGDAGDELSGRVAQLRKDVDMASRLEQIRLERRASREDGGHFDRDWGNRRYTEEFRDYGLNLEQLEPDKAATRIEVSAIREQLIAALDDWLMAPPSNRERLLAALAQADAEPWRRQLRAAFVTSNLKALRELAREANAAAQPPADAVLLGLTLGKLGDKELAVGFLRRAQQEHPDDFWVNETLGMALDEVTPPAWDEAVRFKSAAVALRPDSSVAHNNLGWSLRGQRKLDEAIAEFRRAIELQRKNTRARRNLASTFQDLFRMDEAVAEYRELVRLQKDDASTYIELGEMLAQQGKCDEAVALYRQALKINPDNARSSAWAHNNLAWLAATSADPKFRDPKQAVTSAERAVTLRPGVAKYWNTLGAAHYALGDWKACVQAVTKSMELRKGGASYDWFLLAMAHWKLGEKDKARERYDKAVEWMDKNEPNNEELRRLRAEAAEVLGVDKRKD
jgi:tetratricopeptide (TPR) repeat protein